MTKFVPGGPARYAHQRRGLQKLIRSNGTAALLFDPGTGKTATMLDYLSVLALKKPDGEARALIICPLAAVDTWVLQAGKWVSPQVNYWAEAVGGSIKVKGDTLAARGGYPFRGTVPKGAEVRSLNHRWSMAWDATRRDGVEVDPADGPDALGSEMPRLVIEVINFDAFSRRDRYQSGTIADFMVEAVRRYEPDIVVIDESHKIKSAGSNVSRALARMEPFLKRRALLTGTVMPSGPLDVYGQWRFMDPYAFGDTLSDGSRRRMTFSSFKARFATLGGYMGRQVIGYKNLDEMQQIMRERAVVARKEDALDLPPTSDVIVPVNLSTAEAKAYEEMKRGLAARFADGTMANAPNKLSQMMRLRQITSGHLPDDNGSVRVIGDSKVRTITSIVHDNLAGEKRVVVFCLFSKEIEMLTAAMAKSGTEVLTITGATPNAERIRMRQRFGSDDPARLVLIAQIKTLSLAVNELVTANHAIFGSLSQQRDDLIQARDRLNRIGQTKPVTFWYPMVPKTVDDVIFQSHADRTSLEAAMLRHITGDTSIPLMVSDEVVPEDEGE